MQSTSELIRAAQSSLKKGDLHQAQNYCRQALDTDTGNAAALHLLGVIAFQKGDTATAINHLKSAADNSNENPEILYSYASVLLETGRFSDALKLFSAVCRLQPHNLHAMNKCAVILGTMGNLKQAKELCLLILSKNPFFTDAYINLGNIYKAQGFIDTAQSYYLKALELNPSNNLAASNLLLCLNYTSNDPEELFNRHLDYERRFSHLVKEKIKPPLKRDTKNKTINVGYISGDFRVHSVGYFIEPIIENHDADKFTIVCYADNPSSDEITDRIKSHASTWRSIYNVGDKAVISMIQKDNIDILVDLAGHSGDNRLTLFLQKPAPIQVSYLGYPNTTGLSTMDYRLTDSFADPERYDRFYTERLVRLPDCFLCYRPPDTAPEVHPTPALKNGFVTFGSFNNLSKINDYTIKVWADLLHAVPDSQLLLKSKPFADNDTLTRFRELFIQRGIPENRLQFKGHSYTQEDHLREYNNIDIALDTFPYNGTATTFESLLMGVPVITLIGNRHAGRVGYSILSNLGKVELIASSAPEYITKAINISKDVALLDRMRQNLRKTLLSSKLCDGKKFTKNLEDTFIDMYRNSQNKGN